MVWRGLGRSARLGMSHSDRRMENNWWGDQDREFVIEGNALMTVTSLLFFLGFLLGHTVILEQPRSSSMPLVPLMASVLAFAKCLRCDVTNQHLKQIPCVHMMTLEVSLARRMN